MKHLLYLSVIIVTANIKTKAMTVYKKNPKTGFIMEINTDGSYRPKGWSLTRAAANKKK